MRYFTQDNLSIEFDLGNAAVVSDPCYSDLSNPCSLIVNTKPGRWIAKITLYDEPLWSWRVAVLSAATDGVVARWDESHEVCVDSGQMSIVDLAYYDGGSDGFGDESTFYGNACALTLTRGAFGGLLKSGRGVVSRSGYGDGAYGVMLGYNEHDEVISIAVIFIEYGPEDQDDDDF